MIQDVRVSILMLISNVIQLLLMVEKWLVLVHFFIHLKNMNWDDNKSLAILVGLDAIKNIKFRCHLAELPFVAQNSKIKAYYLGIMSSNFVLSNKYVI